MTDLTGDGGLLAQRILGASAGAAVSLIHFLPKSRREAASRFLTGLACGIVFGGPTGLWLEQVLSLQALSPGELMLSGSAAASLCAWWGLGILSRMALAWQRQVSETKGLPRDAGKREGGRDA